MKKQKNKIYIIGIDANEANLSERVGVNQYAYEILWALYRLIGEKNVNVKVILYLKSDPIDELPSECGYWEYKILRGGRFWVLFKLTPYLTMHREIDIFFSPSHYLPLTIGLPMVCAIHDLGYLKFSEQFKKYDFWQLKSWTAISISISKYIITFSLNNKNDIVRHYPLAIEKTYVIYHGFDASKFNTQINIDNVRRIRKKYRLPSNYILFLGTLKPSKNIEGLLDAFSMLKSKIKNVKLVIAGKKGWMFDRIFNDVKKLSLSDDVIFTDFVDEDDKPFLISGAKVFACPSFWEGFGIPVIESLACGTPVVISNVGSLPEVGGDSALYVNPKIPKSIYNGLYKVLMMDKKMYNNLVDEGIKQSKKFSWDKAAKNTLKVLMKGK